MKNISDLLMSRLTLKDNRRRKKQLYEELRRIESFERDKRKYCIHNIVLYYGENHEPVFECFNCEETEFEFIDNNISVSKKIQILRENGINIIDVSNYIKTVSREKLLKLIEHELLENINGTNFEFEEVIQKAWTKIKRK